MLISTEHLSKESCTLFQLRLRHWPSCILLLDIIGFLCLCLSPVLLPPSLLRPHPSCCLITTAKGNWQNSTWLFGIIFFNVLWNCEIRGRWMMQCRKEVTAALAFAKAVIKWTRIAVEDYVRTFYFFCMHRAGATDLFSLFPVVCELCSEWNWRKWIPFFFLVS